MDLKGEKTSPPGHSTQRKLSDYDWRPSGRAGQALRPIMSYAWRSKIDARGERRSLCQERSAYAKHLLAHPAERNHSNEKLNVFGSIHILPNTSGCICACTFFFAPQLPKSTHTICARHAARKKTRLAAGTAVAQNEVTTLAKAARACLGLLTKSFASRNLALRKCSHYNPDVSLGICFEHAQTRSDKRAKIGEQRETSETSFADAGKGPNCHQNGSILFFQPGKNGNFPVRQGACEANYTLDCVGGGRRAGLVFPRNSFRY